MQIQQDICIELGKQRVGTEMKVIIDRKESNYYIARTEFSSPEVDPEILISADSRKLHIGSFYEVRITGAEEFDMYAEVI